MGRTAASGRYDELCIAIKHRLAPGGRFAQIDALKGFSALASCLSNWADTWTRRPSLQIGVPAQALHHHNHYPFGTMEQPSTSVEKGHV